MERHKRQSKGFFADIGAVSYLQGGGGNNPPNQPTNPNPVNSASN